MPKNNKSASKNKQGIEAMKYEIARELGVSMGPNATSKCKTAKKYGIPRVALGTFMNNIKLYI